MQNILMKRFSLSLIFGLLALSTVYSQTLLSSGWNLGLYQGASATLSSDGIITISNPGTERWHVQVFNIGISLQNGHQYQVSFTIKALQTQRYIDIRIGRNDAPYDAYAEFGDIFAKTTEQTITKTFVMNQPSDANARMEFNVGKTSGNIQFKNVQITCTDCGSSSSSSGATSCVGTTDYQALRNFLDKNALQTVPVDSISTCGELDGVWRIKAINLYGFRVFQLTTDLNVLTDLRSLELGGNLITKIPMGLTALPELKYLGLSENGLDTLPAQFADMIGPNLTSVLLIRNRIRYVHPAVLAITATNFIMVGNNLCESAAQVDDWAQTVYSKDWRKYQLPFCPTSRVTYLVSKDNQSCVVGKSVYSTTIQTAVDKAVSGDEVVICDGEYNESVLVYDKSINIRRVAAKYGDAVVAGKQTDAGKVRIYTTNSMYGIQSQYTDSGMLLKGLEIENATGNYGVQPLAGFVAMEDCKIIVPKGNAINAASFGSNVLSGYMFSIDNTSLSGVGGVFHSGTRFFVKNVDMNVSYFAFYGTSNINNPASIQNLSVSNASMVFVQFVGLLSTGTFTNVGTVFFYTADKFVLRDVNAQLTSNFSDRMNGVIIKGMPIPSYIENLSIANSTVDYAALFYNVYNTRLENIKIDNISSLNSSVEQVIRYLQNSDVRNMVLTRISNIPKIFEAVGNTRFSGVSFDVPSSMTFSNILWGDNVISSSIINGVSSFATNCTPGSLTLSNSILDAQNCESEETGFTKTVTNVTIADPLFVNASVGDLHLSPNSPALNAGDPNTNILDFITGLDLDGHPRIAQNRIDMGAYESFAPLPISLTVQTDGHGTASGTVASVIPGTPVTITATASSGYQFSQWQIISGTATLLNAVQSSTTITPSTDVVVQANFVPKKILTLQFEPNGSNGRGNSILSVDAGKPVSIDANPVEADYRFYQWALQSGSATVTNWTLATTSAVVSSDATLLAQYLRLNDLTLTKAGQGTVSANGPLLNLSILDTLTIAAVPTNGWVFMQWTASPAGAAWIENSTQKTTRVAIHSDVQITAEFAPKIAEINDGCNDASITANCHNAQLAGPDFSKIWTTNNAANDSVFFLIQWCSALSFEADQYLYLDLDPNFGDVNGYDHRINIDYVHITSDAPTAYVTQDVYANGKWLFESESSIGMLSVSQQMPDGLNALAGTALELAVALGQTRQSIRWTMQGSHDEVATLASPILQKLIPEGLPIVPDGNLVDWTGISVAIPSSSSMSISSSNLSSSIAISSSSSSVINSSSSTSLANPCNNPISITGNGTVAIPANSAVCYKYTGSDKSVRGTMVSASNSTSDNSFNVAVQFYGAANENNSTCSLLSKVLVGNGVQSNNNPVDINANGIIPIYLKNNNTLGVANVSLSFERWQNGPGCSNNGPLPGQ